MNASTSVHDAAPKRGWAGKLGRGAALGLRYFYGLFYLFAFINKLQQGYAWTDYPKQVFLKQLAQIDPNGLMAAYLTGFLIPNYRLVGITITLVWAGVAVGLLLGLCTKPDTIHTFPMLSKEVRLVTSAFFKRGEYVAALKALDDGAVAPRLMVTDTISLADTPNVFESLKRRTDQCKVMIAP